MMYPILASLALALGVHPYALMVAAGIAASCAFMMPVATPPNAIVYASGKIKIGDMIKAGFWLNVLSVLLIVLLIYYWMPVVWEIDLQIYPDDMK